MQKAIFWFRRDLRLEDNRGLLECLQSGYKIMAIFIFDTNIIEELPKDDPRVYFIYQNLQKLHQDLQKEGSGLNIYHKSPVSVFLKLIQEENIAKVFTNEDYEPYSCERDDAVKQLLIDNNIEFESYKDQVIFEKNEILKNDDSPYTVFTYYKGRWLKHLNSDVETHLQHYPSELHLSKCISPTQPFPSLKSLGFEPSDITVPVLNLSHIKDYGKYRDFPFLDQTTYAGPHLRFGTISIRKMVQLALQGNETYLSELIWREFFMQILFHFPKVVNNNFKAKYDGVKWRNNEAEFDKWCKGETGFPLVDAGMRQLNSTGYMHNRVRMITAGFLCKHLLIDWRWGEAYFAKKLLDYDLAANNGNWQWAAGTGCDAAPYFRIFNPTTQVQKFDPELKYIRKWIKEIDELSYPTPIVDHKTARKRCLEAYKNGLAS